jgi:hypothetical protein
MKDYIIKSKQIRTELYLLAGSVGFAFLLNVYSIVRYKTPWTELFSQLGWVLLIGFFIYLIILLIRVLIKTIRSFF